MKIIFYRYGSICEPGVLNAFHALGHDVYEIKEEIKDKTIGPAQCARLLDNVLKKYHADLIFTINYYPVISEVCRIYNILYYSLIVDSPVFELYSDTVKNKCNRIYTFDRGMVRDIKGLQQENVFITPLCADFNRLDETNKNADFNDIQKFSAEVSFVGSLYSEKCLYNRIKNLPDFVRGYIDAVVEAQLLVYGYNFTKELVNDDIERYFVENQPGIYHFPDRSEQDYKAVVAHEVIGSKVTEQERVRLLGLLSEHYEVKLYTGSDTKCLPKVNNCGLVDTYTQMPLVFRNSKINLNMTAKTIQTGLPLRIFDVLACGGFLITNYQEQLAEVFEVGTDLEVYSCDEELLDKVGYYLKHDDLRMKIAHNGYEKVKNNHTYNIRMKQILGEVW